MIHFLQSILGETVYFILQIALVCWIEVSIFILYLKADLKKGPERIKEVFFTLFGMLVGGIIIYFVGPVFLFFCLVIVVLTLLALGVALLKESYQYRRKQKNKKANGNEIDCQDLESRNQNPIGSIVDYHTVVETQDPKRPEFLEELGKVKPPL